jgi:hypothetical protein
MRAARFRGSRIRSPSSPNEPIEKQRRQESPAMPGFFFVPLLRLILRREVISLFRIFIWCGFAARKMFSLKNPCKLVATSAAAIMRRCLLKQQSRRRVAPQGYPIPLGKKSRVRLVTYRQCDNHHFEKTSGPLKRKYFMNFF